MYDEQKEPAQSMEESKGSVWKYLGLCCMFALLLCEITCTRQYIWRYSIVEGIVPCEKIKVPRNEHYIIQFLSLQWNSLENERSFKLEIGQNRNSKKWKAKTKHPQNKRDKQIIYDEERELQ